MNKTIVDHLRANDADRSGRELAKEASRRSPIGAATVWLTVLAACVVSLLYLAFDSSYPSLPELPAGPEWSVSQERQLFFDKQAVPAITEADNANRAAAILCIERIKEMFEKQRQGVPRFAEDMTSWSIRWGVVTRMPGDWWNGSNRVKQFVSRKFESHLFSRQSLQGGIDEALTGFRADVDANNMRLLTQVKAAVESSELPTTPNLSDERFSRGVTDRLQQFSADSAADSVTVFVITEILSGTAGYAAEQCVVLIGTQLAQTTATTAATAGGATATSTAAGGAGGSTVGPWGTAAGIGVGLVIGLAIDWWMSAEFEAKLQSQLITMINRMEQTVLVGSDGKPGLEEALRGTCDQLQRAYEKTIHDTLVREAI